MTRPTSRATRADSLDGLAVRGLTKSFRTPDGPVHAVRGLDLTIPPGQTVALLGPNGAGKSTTIDMMLGLTRPDSGTVSVFGMSPAQAIRAGAVGAMLQVGGVIPYLSVRELITMVASLYPAPLNVDEVIEVANIADIAGRRTTKLSGGQTQRLRFAVALVSNPDLIVLDEPTVALDVEARRDFWATMRTFAGRGKTVVFATHYLAEADAYADRVVLMANGRIVADGSAIEIKNTVGLRTIRATVADADVAALSALPGVTNVDTRGDTVILNCTDSDAALRALLAAAPQARDIEVAGAGLEEAFVQLTRDDHAAAAVSQEVAR